MLGSNVGAAVSHTDGEYDGLCDLGCNVKAPGVYVGATMGSPTENVADDGLCGGGALGQGVGTG